MANSTILYACTDIGLVIINRPGTLPEWLPPRRVLDGVRVVSVWAEPGPPIRVLAAAEAGLLLSENGGRGWQSVGSPAIAAPATAISQGEKGTQLYTGTGNGGLYLSADGGVSWASLSPPSDNGPIASIIESGASPGQFYLIVAQHGAASLLGGSPQEGLWKKLPVHGLSSIAEDVGTGNLYATLSSGVQKGSDRGALWEQLPASPAGGVAILAVAGASGKAPALVVGTPTGLYISPDGGAGWQEAALPQPSAVTALAHDPERRDRLYAATASGFLLESGNRGQSWQPVNAEPLPVTRYLFVVRI